MKNKIIHKLLFGLIFITLWSHSETYLNQKPDEVPIREFIKEIIIDIEKSRVSSLASKFQYPLNALAFRFENKNEFIFKWEKDSQIQSFMELKTYDENDKYVGTIRPKDSAKLQIFFTEWKMVQFAITPGMIFDVKKIANRYKIVSWTSVY